MPMNAFGQSSVVKDEPSSEFRQIETLSYLSLTIDRVRLPTDEKARLETES